MRMPKRSASSAMFSATTSGRASSSSCRVSGSCSETFLASLGRKDHLRRVPHRQQGMQAGRVDHLARHRAEMGVAARQLDGGSRVIGDGGVAAREPLEQTALPDVGTPHERDPDVAVLHVRDRGSRDRRHSPHAIGNRSHRCTEILAS